MATLISPILPVVSSFREAYERMTPAERALVLEQLASLLLRLNAQQTVGSSQSACWHFCCFVQPAKQ